MHWSKQISKTPYVYTGLHSLCISCKLSRVSSGTLDTFSETQQLESLSLTIFDYANTFIKKHPQLPNCFTFYPHLSIGYSLSTTSIKAQRLFLARVVYFLIIPVEMGFSCFLLIMQPIKAYKKWLTHMRL